MDLKEQFEKKIADELAGIAELESKLAVKKTRVEAFQEAIKMLPRDAASNTSPETILREGSMTHKIYKYLQTKQTPVPIKTILRDLGLEQDKRSSVAGALGNYVRKAEIFTRPAPNTFGLNEFDSQTVVSEVDEPPEDFGVDSTEKRDTPADDDIPF